MKLMTSKGMLAIVILTALLSNVMVFSNYLVTEVWLRSWSFGQFAWAVIQIGSIVLGFVLACLMVLKLIQIFGPEYFADDVECSGQNCGMPFWRGMYILPGSMIVGALMALTAEGVAYMIMAGWFTLLGGDFHHVSTNGEKIGLITISALLTVFCGMAGTVKENVKKYCPAYQSC